MSSEKLGASSACRWIRSGSRAGTGINTLERTSSELCCVCCSYISTLRGSTKGRAQYSMTLERCVNMPTSQLSCVCSTLFRPMCLNRPLVACQCLCAWGIALQCDCKREVLNGAWLRSPCAGTSLCQPASRRRSWQASMLLRNNGQQSMGPSLFLCFGGLLFVEEHAPVVLIDLIMPQSPVSDILEVAKV